MPASFGKPRRSPLRVATNPVPVIGSATALAFAASPLPPDLPPEQVRRMMISEFCERLRSRATRFCLADSGDVLDHLANRLVVS